jgi:predicted dehydrogenase
MEKKLKVGIAGFGVVGKRRRQYIEQNPAFRMTAVSDIAIEREGEGVDGVRYFNNYERLYECGLDVLFVCLPNYLAADATIRALQRGMHVFCEKPPACNVRDIKRVIEVERQNPDVRLKYGFNHRYHYSVIEAKKVIDAGKYGKVNNVRGIYGKSNIIPFSGEWRSERKLAGGGILLDQGIHMLDMIRYFTGDYQEIKSFVSNDYWKHDVEDNAYAIMRNADGCVAMLHSTATQWQHKFRLEITLNEASIELTGILSGSKSYGQETLRIIPRKEESRIGSFEETTTSYLDDHSWRDEVNEFADIVVHRKPVENGNSMDALKVMEMVFRIYQADDRWREAYNINEV